MRGVARTAAAILLLVTACDFPRDAAGTLDRVRGGEMRVGVVARPPWTRIEDGRGAGIEAMLVADWAGRLGARVSWVPGNLEDLVEALDHRDIDVLIAGLRRNTPYQSKLGLTQPYFTTDQDHVIAVSAGENAFLLALDRYLGGLGGDMRGRIAREAAR